MISYKSILNFIVFLLIGCLISGTFYLVSGNSINNLSIKDKFVILCNSYTEKREVIEGYKRPVKEDEEILYFSKNSAKHIYTEDKANFIGYLSLFVFLSALSMSSYLLSLKYSPSKLFGYLLAIFGFGFYTATFVIEPPESLVKKIKTHEIIPIVSKASEFFDKGKYKVTLDKEGKNTRIDNVISLFKEKNSQDLYNSIMIEGLSDGQVISDCQMTNAISLSTLDRELKKYRKKIECNTDDLLTNLLVSTDIKSRPLVDMDVLIANFDKNKSSVDEAGYYTSNIELGYLRAYSIYKYIVNNLNVNSNIPIYISSSSCAKGNDGTNFELCDNSEYSENRVGNIIFYYDSRI